MPFNINMGLWDILLIIAVSLQATAIAYLPQPKWKALMISFPLPFYIAFLAVGRPVDSTNVLGMILYTLFTYGNKFLHKDLKIPIVPTIAISVVGYCTLGIVFVKRLPTDRGTFWIASAVTLALAVFLLSRQSPRNEKSHQSPLPIWTKLPIIIAVVFTLLMIKSQLRGCVTVFPMVGVVAAYEARYSLATMFRQMPIMILTFIPMMIFISLTQPILGTATSLLLSSIVFLAILIPLTRHTWSKLPDQYDNALNPETSRHTETN